MAEIGYRIKCTRKENNQKQENEILKKAMAISPKVTDGVKT